MRKLLAQIILLSDSTHVSVVDWWKYTFNLFIHLAPFVIILKGLDFWIENNKQFGVFLSVALLLNMIVGAWFHLKKRSFSFWQFLVKNAEVMIIVVIVYIMLEMLRYTLGDNIAGETFRAVIQVSSLLYPTSKVFKNIYILSKGKVPSEFIMRALYNFEKSGDLSAFVKSSESKKEENIDPNNFKNDFHEEITNEDRRVDK